ncbi:MAG: phosphate uptake regulator PhoU [Candidatus Bathyarchaeota archaeon]|nr:phosphate uptake regulator PhoU [Candidatus Bathyarchaeota archaeon]
MERKVMSLGKSSLVISLPHDWMQINDLKKGDSVSFIIQGDRSLVVYPSSQKKAESREITLNIGEDEEEILINQKILGSFLNGYTGIRLISEKIFNIPQAKAIRNMAGRLFMRVMESDSKRVYMQSLTDESQASLEQAIQRMHLISRSMCEGAVSAIKRRDTALAKSVYSLDDDVDHFAFFILRILRNAAQNPMLASELHIEPLDCMDYQILVYRMEHAADYAAIIARNVIMIEGNKQKIPDDLSDLIVATAIETIDLYVKAVTAFFSRDVLFAVEIMKSQQRMEKLYIEIASKTFTIEQKSPELVCAICTLRDNIRRIAHCALSIAEVAVNRAFKMKPQEAPEESDLQ